MMAAAKDQSDASLDVESDDHNDFELVDHLGQVNLEKLKSLRDKVKWENKHERRELLKKLYPSIGYWGGQIPHLHDIFRPEEIERLISECVDCIGERRSLDDDRNNTAFIRFVARAGFRSKPRLDDNGKPLLRRTTPLHLAATYKFFDRDIVVRELFEIYGRFDYTDEDTGLTHFHLACVFELYDIVESFLAYGQDPNSICQKTGDSPLYMALNNGCYHVSRLLLRCADLNLPNKDGMTPLHAACRKYGHDGAAQLLFEINDHAKRQTVKVDAQDKWGNTPLNLAVRYSHDYAVELLLNRGADPSLANIAGMTPLHYMCKRNMDERSLGTLFDLIDREKCPSVPVDVRDKLGKTPLHYAVAGDRKKQIVEFLLTRGAEPNATDDEGETPLHKICKRDNDDDLVEIFFKANDKLNQSVRIDARNNKGRTPLQEAVASLAPRTVGVLLDRGADLSCFVFPTASHFEERYVAGTYERWLKFKLWLASGALSVCERLEHEGYELKRSDALAIMKLFSNYGWFRMSTQGLDPYWYDDEDYASVAKRIAISSSLSLYDLIQLPTAEAAKLLKFRDHFRFEDPKLYYFELPKEPCEIGDTYVCEILSRRFFRRWALDSLSDLWGDQLPILCCEKIIEKLTNEDLYHICLAAVGQNA